MKITDVETLFVDRYLFVKVHTDAGLTGLGESGAWGYLEASAAVLETFKRYLAGQDPRRVEHHWQYLYRRAHFRGAAVMGALSAVDLALWDILGKSLGVPCYALLGGRCRDRVRVYRHVIGDTKEKLVAGCLEAKAQGFTAVGHLTPFLDDSKDSPYFKTHVDRVQDAIETVARYREAVGREVDLCIELHRRLTPAEAVVLARGLEPFHPLFIEDPVRPDNFDATAFVAERTGVPIATGERLHTLQEFAVLFKRDALQYARVSVCAAGGLTQAKKIAALAEAHFVGVVPHNPLSPVSTAACAQLAACIPNLTILEYPEVESEGVVTRPLGLEEGFLIVPDAPGLGVELAEDAAERFPYRPHPFKTRLHRDGSVVDQ